MGTNFHDVSQHHTPDRSGSQLPHANFPSGFDKFRQEHRSARPEPGGARDSSNEPLPKLDRQSQLLRHCEISYSSHSTRVCAILMEKYIPDFVVKLGKNCEVPAGMRKEELQSADFLVAGVIFEYHVPVSWTGKKKHGDYIDRAEAGKKKELLRKIGKEDPELREYAMELVMAKLQANYINKRRAFFNRNPAFKDKELVVAGNPEEFYDRIISRFGHKFPGDKAQFVQEFKELLELGDRSEKKQNKKERRR